MDNTLKQGKMKEKGRMKDSTINENNLKYKYKHSQILNQMCLFTTIVAVQKIIFKTTS